MTKIVITGFEPFGGMSSNPSEQLAQRFASDSIAGCTVVAITLPVSATAAPSLLAAQLRREQPDFCIMLGLAEGSARIAIERVAINLADFRIPDNSGAVLQDAAIVADGPAAYFSTLPVRAMLEACRASGTPAELSLSAGAYLCNLIFYTAQHLCATEGIETMAGFIHLPATPEIVVARDRILPSMSLDQMEIGLRAMLHALVAEVSIVADE
jgi:pyroglutamyl-peptidase